MLRLVGLHRLERADRIGGVADRSCRVRSMQRQFVSAERREMALDLGIRHLGERGRLPARRVVLVDDHRAHAFIEIMAMNDARHYAEFGLHARVE